MTTVRVSWQHAEADLARPLLDDKGGVAEDAALRAQLKTLGERPLPAGERPYAHPYYWAAFVLIGDPY
jgi:CHAT domain-containing protein